MKVNYRLLFQAFLLGGVGLLLVMILAGSPPAGRASASTLPPIDDQRVDAAVLEALQAGQPSNFVVEFGKQPDLSGAYAITDWAERGRYVVDALKANATKSQARVLVELDRRGLRSRAFFASNEIYVYGGDASALQALLSLPDVAHIRAPVTVHLEPAGFQLRLYGPTALQTQIESAIDWGITDTGADQFWGAFQNTGQGIVVAGIDTGVDVTHPALSGSYRCAGGNLTDSTCWYDPANICAGQVCDNQGHGTHTMGTMAASNDSSLSYTVGMAPGAEWISCKGCESNTCSDFALLSCADWILAPGDNPAERPQVVNNSWGDVGGDTWFLGAVNAWHAAGIFPSFSAGNSGECSTLGSPGDYQESFGSAAHTSSRAIASFSSKGPGLFGDVPYTKPNISAPGNMIISTYPINIYPWAYMSGTSMASPHTAGAVALLWSCAPQLVGQIDATFQLLQSSADAASAGSCGAPASGAGNYTFGYGYLNVLAAGSQVCAKGQITGHVQDAVSHSSIEGAEITLVDGINPPVVVNTQADGNYSIFLPPGTYSLQIQAYGYLPQILDNVTLINGSTTTRDFSLAPALLGTVSGVVRDGSGYNRPLAAQLTYTASGQETLAQSDPSTGAYSVDLYQANEYQVKVEAQGYLPAFDTVVPPAGSLVRDYSLLVDPDTCDSSGYLRLGGLTQQFEGLSLPPGWDVTDPLGNGQVWTFADPAQSINYTGDSGGFAQVNSLDYSGLQDTSLVTPPMNFLPASDSVLSFNSNYLHYGTYTAVSVDLSLDGGLTWSILWQRTGVDFSGAVPPIDLTSQVAGKSNVRLRFRYINTAGSVNAGRWQVDNVQISPSPTCIAYPNKVFLPAITAP